MRELVRELRHLTLRELEVYAAWLKTRQDNRRRTLPSEVAGEGLLPVSGLVEAARAEGGNLATVLDWSEALDDDERGLLLEVVDELREALSPKKPDYGLSEDYRARENLQGYVMYKYVPRKKRVVTTDDETGESSEEEETVYYGPYAYLRYWKVGGDRDKKRKKLGAEYLGRNWGIFVELLESRDHVSQVVRDYVNKALVYAYWIRQLDALEPIIQEGMRVLRSRLAGVLEDVVPVAVSRLPENSTPQVEAETVLAALFEMMTRIQEERQRAIDAWRSAQGHYLPMLSQGRRGKLTGREPVISKITKVEVLSIRR